MKMEHSGYADMERVEALWFPDGNIVLCAHGVLFRVYKGLLAARSPVFADLLAFDFAQPADAERVEGCPVMQLDDSAADAMYFLKALFDYEFFAPYPAKTDFDAIHGVLRLGTKYRVEPLRQRALQHLSSAHPTTLAEWDALCSPSSHASSILRPPSFDHTHLDLPILTLARSTGASWILPTAFLRALATLSPTDILDGIDYTSVHVELARADKLLLIEAGSAVQGEPTSEVLGFLWSPVVIPGCERTGEGEGMNPCTSSRLAMRVAAERWRSDALLPIGVAVASPHAEHDDMDADAAECEDGEKKEADEDAEGEAEGEGRAIWSEEDFSRLTVCAPCLAHMRADWAARRARFWERLPALFGLPPWAELERERRTACGS